jgi:hypothetical protein
VAGERLHKLAKGCGPGHLIKKRQLSASGSASFQSTA